MKSFLCFIALVFVVGEIASAEDVEDTGRDKRQIYYSDISSKPKTFRSRAEEKDDIFEGESQNSFLNTNQDILSIFNQGISSTFNQDISSILKPSLPLSQGSYAPKPSIFIHKRHKSDTYKPSYAAGHKPIPAYEEPYIPVHERKPYGGGYQSPLNDDFEFRPKPGYGKPSPSHGYRSLDDNFHGPTSAYGDLDYNPKQKREKKNPIPGIAGKDYPIYRYVPSTSFTCKDVPYRPGMYANPEAGCQAYHVCHDDRYGPQGASFLCNNGTLFNQEIFSCDWWYNVECGEAQAYYELNGDPDHNPYFKKPYEAEYKENTAPHHSYNGPPGSFVSEYKPPHRETTQHVGARPKPHFPSYRQSADSYGYSTQSAPSVPRYRKSPPSYKESTEPSGFSARPAPYHFREPVQSLSTSITHQQIKREYSEPKKYESEPPRQEVHKTFEKPRERFGPSFDRPQPVTPREKLERVPSHATQPRRRLTVQKPFQRVKEVQKITQLMNKVSPFTNFENTFDAPKPFPQSIEHVQEIEKRDDPSIQFKRQKNTASSPTQYQKYAASTRQGNVALKRQENFASKPIESQENFAPKPIERQENFAPRPTERQENFASKPIERQENFASKPIERHENFAPKPIERQENFAPKPIKRQENFAPKPIKRHENFAPKPIKRQENFASKPIERQETVASKQSPSQGAGKRKLRKRKRIRGRRPSQAANRSGDSTPAGNRRKVARRRRRRPSAKTVSETQVTQETQYKTQVIQEAPQHETEIADKSPQYKTEVVEDDPQNESSEFEWGAKND